MGDLKELTLQERAVLASRRPDNTDVDDSFESIVWPLAYAQRRVLLSDAFKKMTQLERVDFMSRLGDIWRHQPEGSREEVRECFGEIVESLIGEAIETEISKDLQTLRLWVKTITYPDAGGSQNRLLCLAKAGDSSIIKQLAKAVLTAMSVA